MIRPTIIIVLTKDVARIFGLGGLFRLKFEPTFFERKNFRLQWAPFFQTNLAENIKPKPKRANGLHFVLGAIFWLEGVPG